MKKTIYLDTTVPSYYYDNRDSIKTFIDITKDWWKNESKNYNMFLSEATIDELNNGEYPNKIKILKLISKIQVLPPDEEVINIAQIYLDNYLMPNDLKGDALHLAYASFYKIDFLLTWNCNHLANANKKQHIRVINTKLGLFTPEIITPMLLFTEDKND